MQKKFDFNDNQQTENNADQCYNPTVQEPCLRNDPNLSKTNHSISTNIIEKG